MNRGKVCKFCKKSLTRRYSHRAPSRPACKSACLESKLLLGNRGGGCMKAHRRPLFSHLTSYLSCFLPITISFLPEERWFLKGALILLVVVGGKGLYFGSTFIITLEILELFWWFGKLQHSRTEKVIEQNLLLFFCCVTPVPRLSSLPSFFSPSLPYPPLAAFHCLNWEERRRNRKRANCLN